MKTFKKVMNLVPLMLLWLMMTAFVWGWIFTFLTDAPKEEKMVLFIECDVPGDTFIASRMEEHPSSVIRLAQVKPFSYSMMSSSDIRNADLYILSESGMTEYFEWLTPLPQSMLSLGEIYEANGAPYGIRVFDAENEAGILTDHIAYEDQDYFIALGKNSCHNTANENAVSDEAPIYASLLFEIE